MEIHINSLDPIKWPGLITFITYMEVDSWEFAPYTIEEIREIMKPAKKGME